MPKRPFPLGLSGDGRPVYIDDQTRTTSVQVIGATGTGKTKFIEALVREDILRGSGVALSTRTGISSRPSSAGARARASTVGARCSCSIRAGLILCSASILSITVAMPAAAKSR